MQTPECGCSKILHGVDFYVKNTVVNTKAQQWHDAHDLVKQRCCSNKIYTYKLAAG